MYNVSLDIKYYTYNIQFHTYAYYDLNFKSSYFRYIL